jgi:hypothetical protein
MNAALIQDLEQRLKAALARVRYYEDLREYTPWSASLAVDEQRALRDCADLEFALSAARAGAVGRP